MSDDWEFDDEACPKCGQEPTRARRCEVVGCDDGWIDMHEYDDPLMFDPGETEMCDECHGTGWVRWCPKCGHDMNHAVSGPPEKEYDEEAGFDDDERD
jgi:hypothetical protein